MLAGEIRSTFGMTEPNVASSDATNICSSIVEDGDEYVINGEKWWTSGAGDQDVKLLFLWEFLILIIQNIKGNQILVNWILQGRNLKNDDSIWE